MLREANEVMPNLEKAAILAETKSFDPLTRLQEFSIKYPLAMQILRIGGVHPTENAVMKNPYTDKPHDESFSNVGEHCFAVAACAYLLADILRERGLLSIKEVELVTSRALVHDASKRFEIMRRNAVREGAIDDAYTPKAYETIKPILLAQGVSPELVDYMAKAGKETGHLSNKDFLTLQDGIPSLVPGRMADKIIHLADDMTSTNIPYPGEKPLTVYLTTWERMTASDFPNRYPFLWKEGLGFDASGNVVTVQDILSTDNTLSWVEPYAYWQPLISNMICEEIQGIVDPGSIQKPEYFIKNLVNNALVTK